MGEEQIPDRIPSGVIAGLVGGFSLARLWAPPMMRVLLSAGPVPIRIQVRVPRTADRISEMRAFLVAAALLLPLQLGQGPSDGELVPARNGLQGCCSHHHGVCGCKKHEVVCCDGTFVAAAAELLKCEP